MSAPSKLAYFVRTAVGSIVRSPFVHVIAVASLTLALVGFGVARLARAQLDTLVDALGGAVELTVYLADGAEAEQVDALGAALTQRTGGTVTKVSPAEALGRLVTQLGEDGRGLTDLPDNPLPWSLELSLPRGAREPRALAELAEKTRALPFVTGVDYGQEALERLTLIARALEVASLVVFTLVFLTAVIVVSATLQLAIFARREEIEIQKLVGATDRFVRVPFLLEGALQGVVAAGLALLSVVALVRWLDGQGGELLAFARVRGGLVVDWARLAGELFGAGVALGLAGSFIAVRRFLRV
ncbi:MAG: permease-like cell division protein FtsX [Myxococcaceae bacterium]|nr:permease-like cell division protein FtsX [Myxococcaceae bacterium]